MQKPAGLNKKRKMTEELFNKIKTVLQNIEGKKNFESIGQILNCSNTTVRRVDSVATWSEFKKNIEKRSPRRTQKVKPLTIDKYNIKQPELFSNQSDLIAPLMDVIKELTRAIDNQTGAIVDNTLAYKNLRDRMAVANQLKARELHEISDLKKSHAVTDHTHKKATKEGAAQ